jgi:hypothetical protein
MNKLIIILFTLLTGCSSQKFDGLPVTTLTDSKGYTYEIQDNGKALHVHDADYTPVMAATIGGGYLYKKMYDYGGISNFPGVDSAAQAYFVMQNKHCEITDYSAAWLSCIVEYDCKN